MEIKTKFNVGDKVYYFEDGVRHGYIQYYSIEVRSNVVIAAKVTIDEAGQDQNGRVMIEDRLYATRRDCVGGEIRRIEDNMKKDIAYLKTLYK